MDKKELDEVITDLHGSLERLRQQKPAAGQSENGRRLAILITDLEKALVWAEHLAREAHL